MNESNNIEKEIFSEALELPASERPAFLARACGGDEELRERVESLLLAFDQAGDLLETRDDEDPVTTDASLENDTDQPPGFRLLEGIGESIGRYKLLQKIGEGGFGVVYMAEQQEPVVRKVALKVIKLGMDTRSVIARFEAERQALAMMDHPNIARVLDAGATEAGRPFFVMELVRGVPITKFCNENSLTTEERLSLFRDVCAAV